MIDNEALSSISHNVLTQKEPKYVHFFLLAQAPLFAPGQGAKVKLTVQELTDQMWSSRNFLSNVKSEDGKYLTALCISWSYGNTRS